MFVIYKVTNKINNKFYVGYTSKLPSKYRYSGHISSMKRGSQLPLHCAMRKYGIDCFTFEILEMGENHEYGYKIAEPMYIKYLNPEYNITVGGDGVTGYKHSKESVEKRVVKMRGRKQSQESNNARSRALIGRPLSELTKLKMSIAAKKRCKNNIEKQRLRSISKTYGMLGKFHSSDTKETLRNLALEQWKKRKSGGLR